MAFFISGTYLENKPYCKFMLTYDIENYLQQFMKYNTHGLGNV